MIILNPEEQSLKTVTDLVLKKKTTLVFVLLTILCNPQDGQKRMSGADIIASIKVSYRVFYYSKQTEQEVKISLFITCQIIP